MALVPEPKANTLHYGAMRSLASKASTSSLQPVKCATGSYESSSFPQPFHRTKYNGLPR